MFMFHVALASSSSRVKISLTSGGTYCSTAVATAAQQIQSNTITERTRVVVKIHPELLQNNTTVSHTASHTQNTKLCGLSLKLFNKTFITRINYI